MNTKKKILIISSAVALVLLIILITLLCMFLPRKLDRILPTTNIEKIEIYEYSELKEILTADKMQKMIERVTNKKYKIRYANLKCVSIQNIVFYYSDGSKLNYSDLMIKKFDKQGALEWSKKIYGDVYKTCG